MTSFKFPLQKALDWRRTQLGLAEARLQQQVAAISELDHAREELADIGRRTEVEVRGYRPLAAEDLSALGNYRLIVRLQDQRMVFQRAHLEQELAARQTAMLEARRRCRLLERLKERRWAEWQAARDRELEETAADSYLAQFSRRELVKASATYNEGHES